MSDRKTSSAAKLRSRILLALKLGLAVGLFWWLIDSGKLQLDELGNIGGRWPWLIAAQIPFGIVMFLAAVRWRILLKAQKIDFPLSESYALSMIGLFFNQLVPGSTGGDVYKAYAVAKGNPNQRSGAVVSVFVDRALGLIVLLLVVAGGMLANWSWVSRDPELFSFATVIGSFLATLAIGGTFFFSTRMRRLLPLNWIQARLPLRDLIAKFDNAVLTYRHHLRDVLLAAFTSGVLHSLVVATNICLAYALLSGSFQWWHFFYLIPMAHLAMAIPLNPPGAIGTAEAIYAYLLVQIGIEEGAVLCILQRLTYYSWSMVGAGFYITRKGKSSNVQVGDTTVADLQSSSPDEEASSTNAADGVRS